MKQMILFSQAPADIVHVLSVYNLNKVTHEITIVVVNVENNFNFLNSLNLDAKINFIPLVGQENKLEFIRYVMKLYNIRKKMFGQTSNAIIYYFANNYDYVTAFFIDKLIKNNIVNFVNVYNIDGERLKGLKYKLKEILVRLLLGLNVKFFKLSKVVAYQHLVSKNKQHNCLSLTDLERGNLKPFMYVPKIVSNKPTIILLEGNGAIDERFVNYNRDLQGLLEQLALTHKIVVKPHPRLGYSQIINNYPDIEAIDAYIPAEMIDMSLFEIVVGVDSAAIASLNHNRVISVMNLFEYHDATMPHFIKKYLNKFDGSEISYITNYKEIC